MTQVKLKDLSRRRKPPSAILRGFYRIRVVL